MTPSEKMQRYRNKLRAAGLRPVQVWVADTRAPGFAEECRRQSRLVSEHASEQDIMEFLENAQDVSEWND
ncbi:MAG: antitoxin MazE family protein [Chromatiaceae bacterium]|nr:antitoxin MazE family protein [Chromatiaceae bacterium]MCP5441695.1 antitoxin MazE family protein [Chromatiaceae bacterium]